MNTIENAIPNPFGEKGRIETPDRFFDRQDLLRRIFEELRKGSNLSLVGETQVGKSSLLSMICALGPERLQLPPEHFIYMSIEWIEDEDDFYETLCAELGLETCRGGKLQRALRGKRYILCLDEFEGMKWDGAQRSSKKSRLPNALQQNITDSLASIPNANQINTRQALILRAGLDEALQAQIQLHDPPASFFPILVTMLINYGTLEDGRYAINAVLEAAKHFVGQDRGQYCDTLLQEITPIFPQSRDRPKGRGFTVKIRSYLRGLADGASAPLRLVIATRSPLEHLFPDSPEFTSPLAGICYQLDVGPFLPAIARDFLLSRLEGTSITFSDVQIDALLRNTGGHPAKLQREAAKLYRQLTTPQES